MENYVTLEKLPAYAANTARTLPVTGSISSRRLVRSLRWTVRALRRRERVLSRREDTEAVRWLRDNLYLAERESQEAQRALRRCGRLRRCQDGALITALSRVLLAVSGGEATEERMTAFLRGFQSVTVLRGQELRLFPAALRMAAVERLSALYARPERSAGEAGALFTTLRRLSTLDLGPLLEEADRTAAILRRDPAGVYERMDEESRAAYRRQVERLARKYRLSEHRAAERALELARRSVTERTRHLGYYLFTDPLGYGVQKREGKVYALLNLGLPLLLAALFGALYRSAWVGALLVLPASEMVKNGIDRLLLRLTPARHVPRLELREGVPPEGRTLCVVSVLLTGEETAKRAARHLEEYRMAGRDCGENLLFGLLCDLPEAAEAFTAADRARLNAAAEAVEELNRRYGGGFFLLSRERSWSRDTERFAPWERKRGAMVELCRLLTGDTSRLELGAGEAAALRGVRYVLTLDADTRLEPGAARSLIGAALHPLNRPVIDPIRGIVTEGHALFQPRMELRLGSAVRTAFSRLYAPQGGGDPYGGDVGEVYMDVFASGGFAGKGLICVRSYRDCMDKRVPDGLMLSHDAVEGAFLRGAFVGDAALTDGFPATPLSFYSRLHRWVRGDWQNLPWLFARGRALPVIERWRLWDSLRRSLVPAGEMAALGAALALGGPGLTLPALAALLGVAEPYLWELWCHLFRRESDAALRVRARILHGPGETFLRPFSRLALLPWEAWTGLNAALTALWRLRVSGKRRLQWKTAEESDAQPGGLLSYGRAMAVPAAFGLLLAAFAATVAGRAAGAVWMLSPLFAWNLGREKKEKNTLNDEDRTFLTRRAGEIWSYFDQECRAETHFLPPDNVQYEPGARRAERISPTNLGLSLLSALCAAELGLTEIKTAVTFCQRWLDAMERMERWEGHFYNWYDTRTLSPLEPCYVSTVDSGNLCCCLLTAAAGLRARGESALAARAEALRLSMDFTPLYDEKRQLFRIGLRPGEREAAESWYDLLESEERLTGYMAVASGQVPLRHWRRLGRAQVEFRSFRGMVSWSGTMFEYLMPELLLPLYPDSHLGESARFALYVQRSRAVGPWKLWGESESAFAALDTTMHYRYKAHGVPALSLCRDGDAERVIAPYSAYLALLVSPRAAMADLQAFEQAGLRGPRGFWEAVDFTPGRDSEGRGTPVKCVMVHHLGMSLCAIADTLCEGVLRRWFLSDPAMAAYTGLLQERLPLGGALLQRRERRRPRPDRVKTDAVVWEGEKVSFLRPAAAALSNGAYHLLFTASGISRARWGALTLYRSALTPWEGIHGLELTLCLGEERISLLPRSGDGTAWRWSFSDTQARLFAERDGLRWSVCACVSALGAGERREVVITREDAGAPAALELAFEPVLLPERDRRAHPSFARLGLETGEREGALLLRRLPRGGQEEKFLALGASAPARYVSDRHGGGPGWQSEGYITARVELGAGEGESRTVFALCAAARAEDALALLPELIREKGGFSVARVCASLWNMDTAEVRSAWERLPWLLWPTLSPQAAALPGQSREGLWKWGVSGDLPIHGFPCAGAGAVNAAGAEARRHGLLALSGVAYDLVFLPADDADYRRSLRARIETQLADMELGGTVGVPGGVHFAPPEAGPAIGAASALWTGPEGLTARAAEERLFLPPAGGERGEDSPELSFDEEYSLRFAAGPELPRRAWQHLLTDGTLGWLCSESGSGFLWHKNARECPLIPWRGDPLAVAGPEELWAETSAGPVSFFAREGDETRVSYSFGTAVWEKQTRSLRLRLTACVPEGSGLRLFLLESSAPCRVRWCAPLAMAPEAEDAPACTVKRRGDALIGTNPRCPWLELELIARLSVPWESWGTDEAALRSGSDSPSGRSGWPAMGGSFLLDKEAVLLLGTSDRPEFLEPGAARAAINAARDGWSRRLGAVRARGGAAEMLPLLNGWSAWQAMTFRILGRASLYQSGGAVGFRDQLQDYVNLLPLDPRGCREHILACCAHQFREGDMQHWWHPGAGPTDKGVRTRCSDDLLWLPWAVGEYIAATGDRELLREEAPYLSAPPLGPGENSRYETPEIAPEQGTVWDHALRAVEEVLRRGVGRHRLLLMGGGDWNDGFDAMGEGSESVWLSFFASRVLDDLAALAPDEAAAGKLRRAGEMLGRAANEAWEEDHFLRGYFGDGTPLGSREGDNCRIDSLPQSFAAFCPWADRERVGIALDTALRELWDRGRNLIRLYTPPVRPGERSPGYVAGYGPGFRENGGQYTHAAVWLARACFRTGRWQEGAELLRAIAAAPRQKGYGAEPWLLPADVITAPEAMGRAGWTGYTGAAGWWYRTAWEDMLGMAWKSGEAAVSLPAPAESAGWRIVK